MKIPAIHPVLIQGGMGVGVSGYRLARTVSALGPAHLGVVSGTALDAVFTRRLQDGDPGGDVRRALAAFPFPEIAERLVADYFIDGGRPANQPYKSKPLVGQSPSERAEQLLVASNFVEVFLAKEGHDNAVGINYLTKVQTPLLPSLYGAMLAGVDYVLMGAGIPKHVPGLLDGLARGQPVTQQLDITGADKALPFVQTFDAAAFSGRPSTELKRPTFLAIVSGASLANMLARRADGHVDGFIVEHNTAGGHNAPPRGKMQLNERGEPIYGNRDEADLSAFRALQRPFWLAGGWATPERIDQALAEGATGIQVGTAFAFCRESGIREDLKTKVIESVQQGRSLIFTDPKSSPTGFPFKGVTLDGTVVDANILAGRVRRCDQGYLREGYVKEDGTLGWRCASEPAESYTRKGADGEETQGRLCLCNGLLAGIGLGQVHADGIEEPPLLTAGDALSDIPRFIPRGQSTYSAADVVREIMRGRVPEPVA
jgi:nitronate monooxygenase